MEYCIQCGTELQKDMKFCIECGASKDGSKPAKKALEKSIYEYLVIPFVGQLKGGILTTENAGNVSRQLQEVINQHSIHGWEFYSLSNVNIMIRPGCLASLFGRETSSISVDQLVFRKKRQESEPS